jgi:hypothetical protein
VGRLTIKQVNGVDVVVERKDGGGGQQSRARPSTAPANRRKRTVKSTKVEDTDKQKTPFEIEEEKNDNLKKVRREMGGTQRLVRFAHRLGFPFFVAGAREAQEESRGGAKGGEAEQEGGEAGHHGRGGLDDRHDPSHIAYACH